MPDLLKKYGDKATTLAGQGSALATPLTGEAQSIKDKSDMLDQYKQSTAEHVPLDATKPVAPTADVDKLNPAPQQYGTQGQEKRIDVTNMMKPLGRFANGTDSVPETGPYILEKGEKVVPTEENPEAQDIVLGAKQYENPKGLNPIPTDDTEGMFKPDVKMLHKEEKEQAHEEPAKLSGNHMDTSNPAPAQIIPKEAGLGKVAIPGETTSAHDTGAPTPDPTGVVQKQRDLVQKDKAEAAGKGDLVGLGTALLHERELNKTAPVQAVMDEAARAAVVDPQTQGVARANPAEQAGAPAPAAEGVARTNPVEQNAVTGPKPLGQPAAQPQEVLNKIPGAPETHETTPVDAYKAKIAGYDQGIQQALDSGDAVKANQLKVAKLNLQKMNPYGSEGNHPGILGKIEHGLATAGNIAGAALNPGLMTQVPGSKLNRDTQEAQAEKGIEQGEATKTAEADTKLKEAQAKNAGVGKTPAEITFHDLMHGGENGGPQINPDTQKPYTAQEAQVGSQGTGKTPEELDTQDLMKKINPATGKPYTRLEAHKEALQMKTDTRPPSEKDRVVLDYMTSHGLENTPENRDKSREALERRDVTAKTLAALPASEAKARFQANLTEEEQALNRVGADSLTRGKSADEKQATEDARSQKVNGTIRAAQDALNDSDHSQFAASIAPVVATMATSSAEGIKRINAVELGKFTPTDGSLYRWAEANTDKFLSGDIPDDYRKEVGAMLTRLQAAEHAEHLINTHAIDTTIRNGATQPVVDQKSGKATKTEPSTKQEPVETNPPANSPAAAQGASGFAAWKDSQKQKK